MVNLIEEILANIEYIGILWDIINLINILIILILGLIELFTRFV